MVRRREFWAGVLIAFGSAAFAYWTMFAGVPRALAQETATVTVTFYLPTGNVMRNGQYPFVGAAACSSNFSRGTVIRFHDGREVVCLDTGALGSRGWVDVFVPYYAMGIAEIEGAYGQRATVEVLR